MIWTTEGPQVVIPPDFVDQLKMLPDHTFPSALRDVRSWITNRSQATADLGL